MNDIYGDEVKCISNLYELEDISKQIEELQNKIEQISKNMLIDPYARKLKVLELIRKKEHLKNILLNGIPIDCTHLKQQIEKEIIEFLKPYGFKKDFILEKLQ